VVFTAIAALCWHLSDINVYMVVDIAVAVGWHWFGHNWCSCCFDDSRPRRVAALSPRQAQCQ